jgi:hypothetical protein
VRLRGPETAQRSSTSLLEARPLKSPKNKGSEANKVLMGEKRISLPEPSEPNSPLQAALDRWKRAFEESRRR